MKSWMMLVLLLAILFAGPLAMSFSVELSEGWKQGPLPPKTYNWGAVVLTNNSPSSGFYFADFKGDHVVLSHNQKRVEANQIGYYNNSIRHPVQRLAGPFKQTSHKHERDDDRCTCGWSVWDEGGMNREGTYEPLVAAIRAANHAYDCPVREAKFLAVANPSAVSAKPRDSLLRRAGLRTVLRLKAARATGEEKDSIQKVLKDPQLFDSLLDGLSESYDSQSGGAVDDWITWLKENWTQVAGLIIQLVLTFLDEGPNAMIDWEHEPALMGPRFMFASHAKPKCDDVQCELDDKCHCYPTCKCKESACTSERRCQFKPRASGRLVQATKKTARKVFSFRPLARRQSCCE